MKGIGLRIAFAISCILYAGSDVRHVGRMPVPVLKDLSVASQVGFDSSSATYTYEYKVTRPAANVGCSYQIAEDLQAPPFLGLGSGREFSINQSAAGAIAFDAAVGAMRPFPGGPHPAGVIPFGLRAPSGWAGYARANQSGAEAGWRSDWKSATRSRCLGPGQTLQGLTLVSHGIPTIRTMTLRADWVLVTQEGEATEEEERGAQEIGPLLSTTRLALGPSPVRGDRYSLRFMFERLPRDLTRAVELHWSPDATLAQRMRERLQAARAMFERRGADQETQAELTHLLDLVKSAVPDQLTASGYGLLYFGVVKMLSDVGMPGPNTPPRVPPVLPRATIATTESHTQRHPVGGTATIAASLIDLNTGVALADYPVSIRIEVGPNAATTATRRTDARGAVVYSYSSRRQGLDIVQVRADIGTATATAPDASPTDDADWPEADTATVLWQGGPDLLVSEFSPSLVDWRGQGQIHITDTTKNIGDFPETPSKTRYYIATQQPVDPKTATSIGERSVPALGPGQADSFEGDFMMPAGLKAPGSYFLRACANADNVAPESNYGNNCYYRSLTPPADQRSN